MGGHLLAASAFCRSYIYMGKDGTRVEQEVNCIILHTLNLFIPHNAAARPTSSPFKFRRQKMPDT